MKWSGQAHFSCFDGGQIIEKETKGGRWKKLVMKKRQEVECRNMLANSLYMYTAKQEWEFRWKMREEATWKRREWIDGGEQVSIYSTDIERRRGKKKNKITNQPPEIPPVPYRITQFRNRKEYWFDPNDASPSPRFTNQIANYLRPRHSFVQYLHDWLDSLFTVCFLYMSMSKNRKKMKQICGRF